MGWAQAGMAGLQILMSGAQSAAQVRAQNRAMKAEAERAKQNAFETNRALEEEMRQKAIELSAQANARRDQAQRDIAQATLAVAEGFGGDIDSIVQNIGQGLSGDLANLRTSGEFADASAKSQSTAARLEAAHTVRTANRQSRENSKAPLWAMAGTGLQIGASYAMKSAEKEAAKDKVMPTNGPLRAKR